MVAIMMTMMMMMMINHHPDHDVIKSMYRDLIYPVQWVERDDFYESLYIMDDDDHVVID